MKYLQKSFTVAVSSPRTDQWLKRLMWEQTPQPKIHEYVGVGGLCFVCALDEKGHNLKQEELKDELRD